MLLAGDRIGLVRSLAAAALMTWLALKLMLAMTLLTSAMVGATVIWSRSLTQLSVSANLAFNFSSVSKLLKEVRGLRRNTWPLGIGDETRDWGVETDF